MNAARRVALYGVGNFGYAMLKHLDSKQPRMLEVRAYDRDQALLAHLRQARTHPLFHPGVRVSDEVIFATEVSELLDGADVLVLAVSSDATREVITRTRPSLSQGAVIVNTAKALDYQSGRRLSEVVTEMLEGLQHTYALLAGGTVARDLFEQQPLGVDVACEDPEPLALLDELFSSQNLHVYRSHDLIGTEYAAAFKNVIAILAGIVHGLGFSYGAETHVISSTAQLVADAVVSHLGGRPETFSLGRQCWGNDLWMSCTGETRNREFGVLLGRGVPVDDAIQRMQTAHKTVEGLNTVHVLDRVEPIRRIVQVELLHELIVHRSIDIDSIRNYLMRTHL